MTVENIIEALKRQYFNHMYQLSNAYIFNSDWESDFFSMSNSNYFYEFEIKLSRSDYFNDFKKYKHSFLKSAIITKEYKEKIPHRFFFVVPEGLIKPDEVPEYAGLLYVIDRGTETMSTIRQVKASPFIHKNRFDDIFYKILLNKYYWKYQQLHSKLYNANYRIKVLEKQAHDRDDTIQGEHLSKISSGR